MYARETKHNYDPSSSPVIERPLSNRGWGGNLQNNVFTRFDSLRKENSPLKSPTDADLSPSKIPGPSPAPSAASAPAPAGSPRREIPSPIKSSLTSNSRFNSFESEHSHWPEDEEDDARVATPRAQPRHAKSVTFETAPPEINEYEQQTPEPSSIASGSREGSYDSDDYEDNSFERASSADEDSFDASLEDTDKTPVVLPEDWRHMSPELASNELADDYDDVFDENDEITERNDANSPSDTRPSSSHSDSANSDAEVRPLPPLPGVPSLRRERVDSGGLAAAAERASSIQRSLPSPPRPASVSKDEILRMREANMSLEDRMNLLALQSSLADVQKSQGGDATEEEQKPTHDSANADAEHSGAEEDDLADFDFAPSISRESILRNVKSQKYEHFDADLQEESMVSFAERDYRELANLDPDVPIPSRETSTQFDAEVAAAVKEEDENSYIDLSAVPSFQLGPADPRLDDYERQSSVIHTRDFEDDSQADDDESRYSSPMSVLISERPDESENAIPLEHEHSFTRDEAFATPIGNAQAEESSSMGLPLSFLETDDFDFGLKDYMAPTTPVMPKPEEQDKNSVLEPPELLRPGTATEDEGEREGSVDSEHTIGRESFGSVIHGSMIDMSPPPEEGPIIPERKATIRTQGKLKARPSGTPADLEAMKAQRRHVSQEVPAIPDRFFPEFSAQTNEHASSDEEEEDDSQSLSSDEQSEPAPIEEHLHEQPKDEQETEISLQEDTSLSKDVGPDEEVPITDALPEKEEKRRQSRKMKLDLDFPPNSFDDDMGLGLDAEFDRVIESQKVSLHACHVTHMLTTIQKGYLMRQNTKVIVASNRNFSDELQRPLSPNAQANPSTAGSRGMRSPRKSSAGEKFLTTEPWNGKTRRKSSRRSSGRKSNIGGPAPPLPGHESSLGVVDEYMTTDEAGDGEERGRLFVKVVGVKELDLPLPRSKYLCKVNVEHKLTWCCR